MRQVIPLACLFLVLLIGGCKAAPDLPNPTPAAASPTAVREAAASPSPDPTLDSAPAEAPEFDPPPSLSDPIPEYAVTRIGKGAPTVLAAGPGFLAVGSTIGICLYASPGLEEIWCAATSRAVASLAITADGSRLAAGLADGYLVLWDLTGRTELAGRRVNQYDSVFSLAFSPDGLRLAVNSPGDLSVWDGLSLAGYEQLSLKSPYIGQTAFSPDGRYLAWIDYEANHYRLVIFDVLAGARFDSLELPLPSAALTWTPDSRTVIAGLSGDTGCTENCEVTYTTEGGLFSHHLDSGSSEEFRFEDQDATVQAMALSPDGETLAVRIGYYAPKLVLLDPADPRPAAVDAALHPYTPHQLAWDRAGSALYFIDAGGGLGALDKGAETAFDATPAGYRSQTNAWYQALSPDGAILAVFDDLVRRRLEIYSLPGGALVGDLPFPEGFYYYGMRWSPDGTRLALYSLDTILVYEPGAAALRPLFVAELEDPEYIDFLRWTPNSARVAIGIVRHDETGLVERERLLVLDSATGKILNEIADIGGPGEITPDGLSIAVHLWANEGAAGAITIFNLATGRPQSRVTFSFGLYNFLVLPGGGAILALQQNDLVLFSLPAGADIWRVATEETRINQYNLRLALSPDGRWAAAAGRDVALVNAETGDLVQVFQGHTGLVLDLTFTPDGKSLVTASEDGTVIVWELP